MKPIQHCYQFCFEVFISLKCFHHKIIKCIQRIKHDKCVVYKLFLSEHPGNSHQFKKHGFVTHPGNHVHLPGLSQAPPPAPHPISKHNLDFYGNGIFLNKIVLSFKCEFLDMTNQSCPILKFDMSFKLLLSCKLFLFFFFSVPLSVGKSGSFESWTLLQSGSC